jgi:hypothetical protein
MLLTSTCHLDEPPQSPPQLVKSTWREQFAHDCNVLDLDFSFTVNATVATRDSVHARVFTARYVLRN